MNLPLDKNWEIRRIAPGTDLSGGVPDGGVWIAAGAPRQIHKILLENGLIENATEKGRGEDIFWVAESDWLYRCDFANEPGDGRQFLVFEGLDTLVDIYLNGRKIGSHNNMYLPLELEVSRQLASENRLVLHFRSPFHFIESEGERIRKDWNGEVLPSKCLRKPQHDFDGYLGAKPYHCPIGNFGDIRLIEASEARIRDFTFTSHTNENLDTGMLIWEASLDGKMIPGTSLSLILRDPEGRIVSEASILANKSQLRGEIVVNALQLWWPVHLGEPRLYTLSVKLLAGGSSLKEKKFRTGFRHVEYGDNFQCRINGTPVRLWGANLSSLDGLDRSWDEERFDTLKEYISLAGMNALRIWGEGDPCPDTVYDFADEQGILLWQDFFGESKFEPEYEEYMDACRDEAVFQINRLKHRPSVIYWCGGNEKFFWASINNPGKTIIGEKIITEIYRDACADLDPATPYLTNSPWGGDFPNDPAVGDTHGYDHQSYYVPDIDYPVMFSESTRTSPTTPWSMRRFMSEEELWPADYDPAVFHGMEYPLPASWVHRGADFMWDKTGPLEDYFVPRCANDLIYNMAMARADHIRESVGNCRRGRPGRQQDQPRKSWGHLIWKLNDTWPQIYTSVIDYYGEAYIPYYELKRQYTPLHISFEISDRLYLWAANDSGQGFRGSIRFRLFDMEKNEETHSEIFFLEIDHDRAFVVSDLKHLGMIPRTNVLSATLLDESGESLGTTVSLLKKERYQTYPDPELRLELRGDQLIVETDAFARCIELKGESSGDPFGWIFEDNYFDLLPGETKSVRIIRSPGEGTISAKTHYSDKSFRLSYKGA